MVDGSPKLKEVRMAVKMVEYLVWKKVDLLVVKKVVWAVNLVVKRVDSRVAYLVRSLAELKIGH